MLIENSDAAQKIAITLEPTLVGRHAGFISRGGILEDQSDCLEKAEI